MSSTSKEHIKDVCLSTGCTQDEARAALTFADGEVGLAIVNVYQQLQEEKRAVDVNDTSLEGMARVLASVFNLGQEDAIRVLAFCGENNSKAYDTVNSGGALPSGWEEGQDVSVAVHGTDNDEMMARKRAQEEEDARMAAELARQFEQDEGGEYGGVAGTTTTTTTTTTTSTQDSQTGSNGMTDEELARFLAEEEEHGAGQRVETESHETTDKLVALALVKGDNEMLKRLREQEEEDARIAAELARQFEQETTTTSTANEPLVIQVQGDDEYDAGDGEFEKLDVSVANGMTDAEYARFLAEEEERDATSPRGGTPGLLRTTSNDEASLQLAKALAEMEEMRRQVEELRAQQSEQQASSSGHGITLTSDIRFPEYWEFQSQAHEVFDVTQGTREWNGVAREFLKTMKGRKVTRIERNQNLQTWKWYFLKSQDMENNGNEKMLWHGSRGDVYDTIIAEGFDHRVSNLHGAIGAGIYFGTSASISSGYVGRTQKMLYCRVLVGDSTRGKSGLRAPPYKPNTNRTIFGTTERKPVRYDSTSGTNMFCVFDNAQCYAEYIVHFT